MLLFIVNFNRSLRSTSLRSIKHNNIGDPNINYTYKTKRAEVPSQYLPSYQRGNKNNPYFSINIIYQKDPYIFNSNNYFTYLDINIGQLLAL